MQVNGIIETHRRNKHNLYLHGITNNTNHVVFPSPGILMYAPAAMIWDGMRCIRCGLCAKRCPTGAIAMEHLEIKQEVTLQ
jgi:ferredoxin